MRLVTPVERVLIALGPSRNIALLTLDQAVMPAAAMAQVMGWVDRWPRLRMVFRAFGPWHRADETDIDPARHVIAVEAGEAPIEELLSATLTGATDDDIPPWRLILVNPADGHGGGPCRIIVHFDHTVADGMRFVNILSGGRCHARRADEFAAAAARMRRLTLAQFLGLPRDPRINAPDVALLATDIREDLVPGDRSRAGATRRLTQAITGAVARVARERRINERCAIVSMTGRRQSSEANAITAVEVDSGPDDRPVRRSAAAALVSRFVRQQWFMVAGQTVLSFFPSGLARRLTAGMATQWDGLLTLVPFGRRPLRFAGHEVCEIWGLTVPVLPVPLLLVAVAYRNRFRMSAVTAWEWRGQASAFAAALEAELCPPAARSGRGDAGGDRGLGPVAALEVGANEEIVDQHRRHDGENDDQAGVRHPERQNRERCDKGDRRQDLQ